MTTPMKVAVLSTSVNPESRSRLLAHEAFRVLGEMKIEVALLDLRDFALPFCGSEAAWTDPAVARIRHELRECSHVIFAVPIYNYDVNAVAKNLVELMGEKVFGGKTIGFLCAAGGRSSYMSVLPFANSLMLDFRCWIAPRFVYATGDDFDEQGISNREIHARIAGLVTEMLGRDDGLTLA